MESRCPVLQAAKYLLETLDFGLDYLVSCSAGPNKLRKSKSEPTMPPICDTPIRFSSALALETPKEQVPDATTLPNTVTSSSGISTKFDPTSGQYDPAETIPASQTLAAIKYAFLDTQLCNKKVPSPALAIVPAEWIVTAGIQEIATALRLNVKRQVLNEELKEEVDKEMCKLEVQEQQELEWRLETLDEEFGVLMKEMMKEMRVKGTRRAESGQKGEEGRFSVEVLGSRELRLESEAFWGGVVLEGEEEVAEKRSGEAWDIKDETNLEFWEETKRMDNWEYEEEEEEEEEERGDEMAV